jgi:hypothetical protein
MDANQALIQMVGDLATRADADRRAHVVVDLATLTILIDAKLVTIEEAAARIEKIQSVLQEPYRAEDVSARIKIVTEWLRSHVKQPSGQWTPVVIQGGLDQNPMNDPEPPSPT